MATCVNCGADPEVPDRGRLLNEWASLCCRVVYMRERVATLEKQARKTPAKTMHDERRKVWAAKHDMEAASAELAALIAARDALHVQLEALGAWQR